jgi:hypothetical protein
MIKLLKLPVIVSPLQKSSKHLMCPKRVRKVNEAKHNSAAYKNNLANIIL